MDQNWNRACGALAASEHHVRAGKFVGAGTFTDQATAKKAAADEAAANTTVTNASAAPEEAPPSLHVSFPPPPPAVTDSDHPEFNVTRALVSVCALLRQDVRSRGHLLGVVIESDIHPLGANVVRESCVLVTGTSECRRAGYIVGALNVDEPEEVGAARRRNEL